ncbi:STAS domain-containing protein [Streptomyces sp. NPDC057020]|uniref:STAS domain-containing protein n=1 Tax=unclassified Streptomyces TaxID=2593676 RepID=UPI0009A1273A|nr:STAS domain-containing protein [Streptomyces sp. CB02009]
MSTSLNIASDATYPDRILMTVTGELDPETCSRLASATEMLTLRGRALLLDLSGMTFIDSGGVKTLLALRRRVQEAGGALQLCGPGAQALHLLDVTGTRHLFTMRACPPRAASGRPASPAAHGGRPVVRDADTASRAAPPPGSDHVAAFRHVKEQRDVNTVVLTLRGDVLMVEAEANWTPEELVVHMPLDQARLIVHEVSYATRTGARRRAHLLIWWMPASAHEQEHAYQAAFETLKRQHTEAPVHVIARTPEHLAHPRLVALAD